MSEPWIETGAALATDGTPTQDQLMLSIAISLKRIADAQERLASCVSGKYFQTMERGF